MVKLSICAVFVVTLALALAATPEMYSLHPGEPTLVDIPYFNRTADADFVKEAIKTVDRMLLMKLAHLGSMRSRKQRLQILETLKDKHSIDLVNDYLTRDIFEVELGVLIRGLFMSRGEFLAREIRWAIDGIGTDENTLTDVFCCLDPNIVAYTDIEAAYTRLNKKHRISKDVLTDESGPYSFFLRSLMYNRSTKTNDTNAKLVATTYFNKKHIGEFLGCGMEEKYGKFFGQSSFDEINRTAKYFKEFRNNETSLNSYLDLATSFSSHSVFTSYYWNLLFSGGNFHELTMSIINYSTDKIGYFMNLIVDGLNNRDYRRTIRAIVLQADDDLELVKQRYLKNKEGKQTLAYYAYWRYHTASEVGDRSNDAKALLIKILCGNRDPERDLDLERRWDNTKKCPEGDKTCGYSRLCLDPQQ